jgi:AbrB family looped-hinge helix DNA binding protein
MQTEELCVGKQGRIVIPANLRHKLAIVPGAQLVAWVEDGRLIMESKDQLWHTIHTACDNVPQQTNLAQELINERRVAAKQENQ